MYDAILVPVDGSDPSRTAGAVAVELAAACGADLQVLSVAETTALPVAGELPDDPDRSAFDVETHRAMAAIESRAEGAGVPCRTRIERGDPRAVIERAAAEGAVDLVAMGTHGRTGLRRLLLGSVTEHTLRTASVPVLTAREGQKPGAVDGVLVPTDGSPCAERAARQAFDLARRTDARVHVVSVVDVPALAAGRDTRGGIQRAVRSVVRKREQPVGNLRRDAAERGLACETSVLVGTPDRAIRDYAGDHDVDLVVMGTHGRDGVDRVLLGSVTERTVRTSPTPVLAVPTSVE